MRSTKRLFYFSKQGNCHLNLLSTPTVSDLGPHPPRAFLTWTRARHRPETSAFIHLKPWLNKSKFESRFQIVDTRSHVQEQNITMMMTIWRAHARARESRRMVAPSEKVWDKHKQIASRWQTCFLWGLLPDGTKIIRRNQVQQLIRSTQEFSVNTND